MVEEGVEGARGEGSVKQVAGGKEGCGCGVSIVRGHGCSCRVKHWYHRVTVVKVCRGPCV